MVMKHVWNWLMWQGYWTFICSIVKKKRKFRQRNTYSFKVNSKETFCYNQYVNERNTWSNPGFTSNCLGSNNVVHIRQWCISNNLKQNSTGKENFPSRAYEWSSKTRFRDWVRLWWKKKITSTHWSFLLFVWKQKKCITSSKETIKNIYEKIEHRVSVIYGVLVYICKKSTHDAIWKIGTESLYIFYLSKINKLIG